MGDVDIAIAVLTDLGERVAAKRAERGLSYREAAAIIGIAPSCMWGIESGKRDPGRIVVLRVLRWLSEDGETWDHVPPATGRAVAARDTSETRISGNQAGSGAPAI